jgi:hypothetical protein
VADVRILHVDDEPDIREVFLCVRRGCARDGRRLVAVDHSARRRHAAHGRPDNAGQTAQESSDYPYPRCIPDRPYTVVRDRTLHLARRAGRIFQTIQSDDARSLDTGPPITTLKSPCSLTQTNNFVRPYHPGDFYNLAIREWFSVARACPRDELWDAEINQCVSVS